VPALLDKVLRAGEGKTVKRLDSIVKQVNAVEDEYRELSDEELRGHTAEFRERLDEGETLNDLLPEAFATVREAASRVLGQRHYDVQIKGGAAMHQGNIAEMKTGEGKTLVSTLPAYLNALAGKGVHIVTVNDYLAERDSAWMGRIHRFLGLDVGVIASGMPSDVRREQYNCDITYGTNNEFGFDYLRDNMARRKQDMVQRGHQFAIVDEVDSILVDEARTPLIISGPSDQPTRWYSEFAKIAQRLRKDTDYEVDEKKRTVGVLEPGIERVEDWLGIDNLYESANTPLIQFLNNSIKAKELYRNDKEYVVKDGEVLIVDEHTGRILSGRRYSEGMHQAVEAKEGVTIKQENQTLATVTLQNFFRLYDKLAGMTGTALTEAAEFDRIYGLGVVEIPTHRPMVRADQTDLIYRTEDAKFNAVVADLVDRHERGQPVLVGTTSVSKSERLSRQLSKEGVPHEVLNAKQHDREAAIIAQAGRKGAVTVATNMAGRGTDIMLGGNPEFIATAELTQRGLDPIEDADEYNAAWAETLAKFEEQVKSEHDEVAELGGLYVLGTERHESRRIDNQLRGRSGRQGDNGESRFYLSLEDDLMRLFKSDWIDMIMRSTNFPEDQPLDQKSVTKAVKGAQAQREAQNFEMRKDVLKYDDVLNSQRLVIYDERRRVLEGEDLREQMVKMLDDSVASYVRATTAEGDADTWNLEQLWDGLGTLYTPDVTAEEALETHGGVDGLTRKKLLETLQEDSHRAYDAREAELGEQPMRELERRVLLSVLDRKWREHLYEMDYLREGIGLRAFAQKQPLVEYQREGYELFNAMMDGIKEESVGLLFNLEVTVNQPQAEDAAAAGASEDAATVPDEGLAGQSDAAPDDESADGEVPDDEPGPVVSAKGLDEPAQPRQMQLTSPSADGDSEVQRSVVRSGNGSGGPSPVRTTGTGGTGGTGGTRQGRQPQNRAQRRAKKKR